MCGIFGFFSKNRMITTSELSEAMSALRHRGPDSAGAVVFSRLPGSSGIEGRYHAGVLPDGKWPAVLAHTRLSIIDLSDAARQPMGNESCPECSGKNGTGWLVYNGEIYNFGEIREELQSKGHAFISRTDSEVILHGYNEWGIEAVNRFRGMFAFAVLDMRRGKLLLVRDRLGVKPLKYFYDGSTFIFASGIKGFLHLIPRAMNIDSVNRFLTLKYIPSPDTVIRDLNKVSPGEYLELDMSTGRVRKERYWKPVFSPKSALSFPEAKEGFRKIFSESVFMRTVSDVPIGVYLSGGMDSSAMVAFLRENGVDDIKTFTIKFDRPGYDESEYARVVSDRFHTEHHEFQTPDLSYAGVLDIVRSLDEPFGDPSYIPTYFLSKFTSGHVKVILSGDGGDELLGGYKRYFIHARGRLLRFLPRMKLNVFRKLPPVINKKKFLGRLQRIEEDLSAGFWGAYLLRFNGLRENFKRFVMAPDFYSALREFSMEDIADNLDDFRIIPATIERFVWLDLQTYLPDYILTKTDLALMAHGVEGRNPFVDYKLVEFANSLPSEYKFRGGGKYILKRILEGYIPREVIYRKKMGFSPPIKYWFRANNRLLYEIFSKSDFVSGDIFDLKRVHQLIEKFKRPEINISEQLWLIMVLELWRRTYRV